MFGKQTQVVEQRRTTTCDSQSSHDIDATFTALPGEPAGQAKLVGRRMEVSCLIKGAQMTALWDTGAEVSLIGESWLRKNLMEEEYSIKPVSDLLDKELLVEGVGSEIPYLGYALLPFHLGRVDRGKAIEVPFLVCKEGVKVPIVGSNVMEEFIRGTSIEEKLQNLMDFGLQEVEIAVLTVLLEQMMGDATVSSVRASGAELVLPAHTCKTIECKIKYTGAESETPLLFVPKLEWKFQNPEIILHKQVVYLKEGGNK